MGHSHDELRDAFGIAGASSSGLLISRLGDVSMWKGTAHSYAAHGATQASQMALGGTTGPGRVFGERAGSSTPSRGASSTSSSATRPIASWRPT